MAGYVTTLLDDGRQSMGTSLSLEGNGPCIMMVSNDGWLSMGTPLSLEGKGPCIMMGWTFLTTSVIKLDCIFCRKNEKQEPSTFEFRQGTVYHVLERMTPVLGLRGSSAERSMHVHAVLYK